MESFYLGVLDGSGGEVLLVLSSPFTPFDRCTF